MSAKAIIGIGLIAVMVGMGVYLMFNYKTAFAQTMKITYQDGCVETYKNGNMTSPECTQGRLLDYQEQLRVNASQNQPWNNLNITPIVNNTVPIVPIVNETEDIAVNTTTVINETTPDINKSVVKNVTNSTQYSYKNYMANVSKANTTLYNVTNTTNTT